MSKPQVHYMMDCFYPDKVDPSGYRKESLRVAASGDQAAISEAAISQVKLEAIKGQRPHHYQLRRVTKKTDDIIFKSQTDHV